MVNLREGRNECAVLNPKMVDAIVNLLVKTDAKSLAFSTFDFFNHPGCRTAEGHLRKHSISLREVVASARRYLENNYRTFIENS